MAVWSLGRHSRVWICIFPLGVLCSDVKRGYVIYVWLKGVSTAESQSFKKRGLYCVNLYVCVLSVEFDRTKQVKTTHCVCFNVSSWLAPQGCHSQETMHLETAGRTHNQIFTHLNWAAVEWHCCRDKLMPNRRWLISLESWNASHQTFLSISTWTTQIPVTGADADWWRLYIEDWVTLPDHGLLGAVNWVPFEKQMDLSGRAPAVRASSLLLCFVCVCVCAKDECLLWVAFTYQQE